jgi:hypothetical protein
MTAVKEDFLRTKATFKSGVLAHLIQAYLITIFQADYSSIFQSCKSPIKLNLPH